MRTVPKIIRAFFLAAPFVVASLFAPFAQAGMPMPMAVFLSEYGTDRLIGISTTFFVILVLVAIPVMYAWNAFFAEIDGESKHFKRIGYVKSLGITFLGVCLFTLILVMVAGSRELLSPGAWVPDGMLSKTVYSVEGEKIAKDFDIDEDEMIDQVRRKAMIRLRDALRRFAEEHDGRLPGTMDEPGFEELWQIPFAAGVSYEYYPEETGAELPLVREPSVLPNAKFSIGRKFEITEVAK